MAAMRRCSTHELPAFEGRCTIRSCVRGIGRRYCPRHGVALNADRKCTYHDGCDFVDGAVERLYHVAPTTHREQIRAFGLVPRVPRRRAEQAFNARASDLPSGVPVFCDLGVAEQQRHMIEQAVGACDLWSFETTLVQPDSLRRDPRASAEMLLVTHEIDAQNITLA